MPEVEEKVSRLEMAIEEFIKSVGIEFNKLYNSQMQTQTELKEYKDTMARIQMQTQTELKEYKDTMARIQMQTQTELKEYKDTMARIQMQTETELREFKEIMRKETMEFKETWRREFEDYKEENRREHREMNKRWGEISNKLGTIVEDIIYPALRPVIKQYFKCEPIDMAMSRRRRRGELKDEYDAIVECEDKVFLVEVKATPRIEYINDFRDKKIERFKILFPEYCDKRLVPIFASLRLEEEMVEYLTAQKMYAMAYREWEYMDILNFDRIKLD